MSRVAHTYKEKQRTVDVSISENISFDGLLLSKHVSNGLKNAGFEKPSPIQLKAIPLGRCGLDLIVQAKSGTGKTCVFSVIALESIHTDTAATQVLVLAPTREIAVQIWEVINSIGSAMRNLECHTFIGGLPLHEDRMKLKKCHIAVGSPGRIKQLIEGGVLKTDSIRLFVLDEADKLLEESFQEQINWIYSSLPDNKQMLALSATYPEYLADHLTAYMRNPTFLRLNISDPALLGIRQYYASVPYHPMSQAVFEEKVKVLTNILSSVSFQQCLIFSNLQTRAQTLADLLTSRGWPTACIAGCLDQKDRNHAMARLKTYKCRILISTDLTSRGIDADKVNMVINLDIPKDHETYLHRIGRAGRFGSFGIAVSLISEGQERLNLDMIEKRCNTICNPLPDPLPSDLAAPSSAPVFLDDVISTEVIHTDNQSVEQPLKTSLHVANTEESELDKVGSLAQSDPEMTLETPETVSGFCQADKFTESVGTPSVEKIRDSYEVSRFDSESEVPVPSVGSTEFSHTSKSLMNDNGHSNSKTRFENMPRAEINLSEKPLSECGKKLDSGEGNRNVVLKDQLHRFGDTNGVNEVEKHEKTKSVEVCEGKVNETQNNKTVSAHIDDITCNGTGLHEDVDEVNQEFTHQIIADESKVQTKTSRKQEHNQTKKTHGNSLNMNKKEQSPSSPSASLSKKVDSNNSDSSIPESVGSSETYPTNLGTTSRSQFLNSLLYGKLNGETSQSLGIQPVDLVSMFKTNIGYKRISKPHTYESAVQSLKAFRERRESNPKPELSAEQYCSIPDKIEQHKDSDALKDNVAKVLKLLEERSTLDLSDPRIENVDPVTMESMESEATDKTMGRDDSSEPVTKESMPREATSTVKGGNCENSEPMTKESTPRKATSTLKRGNVENYKPVTKDSAQREATSTIKRDNNKITDHTNASKTPLKNAKKVQRRPKCGYQGKFAIGHLLERELENVQNIETKTEVKAPDVEKLDVVPLRTSTIENAAGSRLVNLETSKSETHGIDVEIQNLGDSCHKPYSDVQESDKDFDGSESDDSSEDSDLSSSGSESENSDSITDEEDSDYEAQAAGGRQGAGGRQAAGRRQLEQNTKVFTGIRARKETRHSQNVYSGDYGKPSKLVGPSGDKRVSRKKGKDEHLLFKTKKKMHTGKIYTDNIGSHDISQNEVKMREWYEQYNRWYTAMCQSGYLPYPSGQMDPSYNRSSYQQPFQHPYFPYGSHFQQFPVMPNNPYGVDSRPSNQCMPDAFTFQNEYIREMCNLRKNDGAENSREERKMLKEEKQRRKSKPV